MGTTRARRCSSIRPLLRGRTTTAAIARSNAVFRHLPRRQPRRRARRSATRRCPILGFLKGVDFFWTTKGRAGCTLLHRARSVSACLSLVDTSALGGASGDDAPGVSRDPPDRPIGIDAARVNFVLLGLVLACALLAARASQRPASRSVRRHASRATSWAGCATPAHARHPRGRGSWRPAQATCAHHASTRGRSSVGQRLLTPTSSSPSPRHRESCARRAAATPFAPLVAGLADHPGPGAPTAALSLAHWRFLVLSPTTRPPTPRVLQPCGEVTRSSSATDDGHHASRPFRAGGKFMARIRTSATRPTYDGRPSRVARREEMPSHFWLVSPVLGPIYALLRLPLLHLDKRTCGGGRQRTAGGEPKPKAAGSVGTGLPARPAPHRREGLGARPAIRSSPRRLRALVASSPLPLASSISSSL